MADLTTRYLGLTLRTPIVASASPIAGTLDGALRLEDAGAAAVVLPSLVEEEVLHEETELDRLLERGVYAIGFFYPVVPQGKARVRVQVSAAHSQDDLAFAVEAFTAVRNELGL